MSTRFGKPLPQNTEYIYFTQTPKNKKSEVHHKSLSMNLTGYLFKVSPAKKSRPSKTNERGIRPTTKSFEFSEHSRFEKEGLCTKAQRLRRPADERLRLTTRQPQGERRWATQIFGAFEHNPLEEGRVWQPQPRPNHTNNFTGRFFERTLSNIENGPSSILFK